MSLSYSEINGTITFYENTGTQQTCMDAFQKPVPLLLLHLLKI